MRDALIDELNARGINQTQAADLIGVHRAVFSRWVHPTSPSYPALVNVPNVAAFLGLSESETKALFPADYSHQPGRGTGTTYEHVAEMRKDLAEVKSQMAELRAVMLALLDRVNGITGDTH
jgi:hypothetical protein